MTIKIICDSTPSASKLVWAVRLVQKGDMYGLSDALTHDESEPLVEFFDTRYPHTDLGQFVARYQLSTLLSMPTDSGLALDSASTEWQLSSSALDAVRLWLRTCVDLPPAPEVSAICESMRRKALQLAKIRGELRFKTTYGDGYWAVRLLADGTTRNEGYAKVASGLRGMAADLSMWELAKLLDD